MKTPAIAWLSGLLLLLFAESTAAQVTAPTNLRAVTTEEPAQRIDITTNRHRQ